MLVLMVARASKVAHCHDFRDRCSIEVMSGWMAFAYLLSGRNCGASSGTFGTSHSLVVEERSSGE